MKKDINAWVPVPPRTEKNYRFIKKISIAGVQFLENRGQVMASVCIGDFLRLTREPNNPHDSKAIRIDRDECQKLGYVPRQETFDLVDKMDAGIIFIGIITSIRRHEYKIEADIYERLRFPFPDFSSFTLVISGFFSPTVTCSLFTRKRKLIYKKRQPYDKICNCVELKFSPDYWNKILASIQNFNFLAWEKFYPNPGICDGTQWNITIRRRNAKNLKIWGDNSYPEEWTLLHVLIRECLDLNELKGDGKFYIQTLPESSKTRSIQEKLFDAGRWKPLSGINGASDSTIAAKLCAYIPYFEQQIGKKVKWSPCRQEENLLFPGHPIYEHEVNYFNALIYDWGCDFHYLETIREYGFDTGSNDFSDADLPLIRALLTFFTRGERFCDGFQAERIENGWISAILKRLKKICESGD